MANPQHEARSADTALEPYWDAAHAGRLLLRHCRTCARTHYYPRPMCPFCMSTDGEWLQASGVGSIYAWSMERRADPPYVIAFVTLAEGPTLLTNLVECEAPDIAIGQAVELRFETRDGVPVPVFRPLRARAPG